MYSIKITAAEKLNVQSDGTTLLAVDFDVLKDDVVVVHYSHGFDLNTTEEDIQSYMKNFVENYEANQAKIAENAERDAAYAVADKTIENIVGVEIKN